MVQPHVNIALHRALNAASSGALAGVRFETAEARGVVLEEVRRSLRAALETALTARPGENPDPDQLSGQVCETVSAAVSEALERALRGLELRITVGGLPCQAAAEAASADECAAAAKAKCEREAAKRRAPLP